MSTTFVGEEIAQKKAAAGRVSALLCSLLLPLCAWITWPVVELGVNDEWSYAKTVQVLAQTGHVVYNGWVAAIVGWMFYLGALSVKLFGFSFTTVRLSMLPVSMATIYLTHRTMVRCGLNNWNATMATLTLALSPLYLPLAISFMTDVPGLFCVLLCLYACVRALQATTDKAALGWLCFAAFANAFGGMVRQIAWLGVLVMVPSAIWLLRKRPRFVAVGGAAWLISVAFIFGAMHWYHHQLYSVPEDLIQAEINASSLSNVVVLFVGGVLELGFLLLPLMLFFVPRVSLRNRTTVKVFLGTTIVFAIYTGAQFLKQRSWLVPYIGNYVTPFGVLSNSPLHGIMPVVLRPGIRLVLTILLALAAASFVAVLRERKDSARERQPQQISWHSLIVLLLPFTVAYFGLLVPRAIANYFYDRYLLVLLFLAAIPVVRLYQERVQPRLPTAALIPIGLYAVFAVAGTHDCFARFRGYLEAINELRSAGVPATEIDGGLEFDGWTQIERVGYVNDPRIPVRPGEGFRPSVKDTFGTCPVYWVDSFSADFRYGLGASAESCLGPAGFAPVTYHTWLQPRVNKVYIVRVGQPDGARPPQK